MTPPEPPHDDVLPAFSAIILVIIVALFAVRNLPWHLDDDEQAKQAFVSYQMVENDRWLVQETPTGRVATKPPLQGWISVAAYLGMGANGWEIAWRLPAFVAALLILRQLWHTGEALFGNNIGAMLAAAMFGLNYYVPRLATLVRTDMLLTAFIFFTGWLILEKLRTGGPWTLRDRLMMGALLLGSTLTKGPIAYGFLLPGIIAFLIITRKREVHRHVWAGWIAWLVPLAVFGGWVWLGMQHEGFKEQVIGKEFLGRFATGENAPHHNQWPGFYTLKLIVWTLPWSLLLIGMLSVKEVRAACKVDPALMWLVCWSFGGLIFMECVPSKRFDRILPVLPPMCLLLAASARYLPNFKLRREPIGRIAILAPLIAVPIAAGAAGWKVFKSFRNDARALVALGETTRATVDVHRDRLGVVNGKDEGMLMYTGAQHFTRLDEALQMWRFKRLDWLVLGDDDFTRQRAVLEPFEILAATPLIPEKYNSYKLLHRLDKPTPTPVVAPVPTLPPAGGESMTPPVPLQPKPSSTPPLQPLLPDAK